MKIQSQMEKGESFTRLRSLRDGEEDLQEARRVGYIVQTENDVDDHGGEFLFSFSINDDETGDLIMCGLGPVNGTHYATSLSKLYFQEPAY